MDAPVCDAGRPAHDDFAMDSFRCKCGRFGRVQRFERTHGRVWGPRRLTENPRLGDWQHAVILLAEGPQRVKGRIVVLSIVVRTRSAVTGALSFDDVRIADAGDFFELREDAPVDPPITAAGELAPRLGVNIHVLRDDSALDRAKNLGFRFVRMDLLWSDVERNGRYRFAGYDALLRALETRGMGALWILDYGHPDHGGQAPRKAEDIAGFGRL